MLLPLVMAVLLLPVAGSVQLHPCSLPLSVLQVLLLRRQLRALQQQKQQLQQLGAHVPSPIQEALQHQGPPQGLVGGTGISGLCLASQPVLLPVAQV